MNKFIITSKRVNLKLLLVSMAVLLVIAIFLPLSAHATETRVTTNTADQYLSGFYGNKLVWTDYRNSQPDTYMYNIDNYDPEEEKKLTPSSTSQFGPYIQGNKVVWTDYRNGNPDIYMYNISTGQTSPISTDGNSQFIPTIYGDKVVWEDNRNGNWDIYMYNINTGQTTPIVTEGHDQYYPIIFGNKIIWTDYRNINGDIYMYNISTGHTTRITPENHEQFNPAIYGDKIVWEDKRNGNSDIYMYNIRTGQTTPIITEGHDQKSPAIYGDKVVWEDFRNGNWDIYMYDMSTDHTGPIVTEGHDQFSPLIYGNNIAWQDKRNGNFDVYYKTFSNAARSMSSAMSWDSGVGNWDWSGSKVTSGDFNGNGLMDLVAFYGYGATRQTKAWVFINNGHGGYNAPVVWWDSGPNNWDWDGTKLTVGDYNGDGLADIGALYGYAAQHQSRAFIFTSNGINAFNAPTTWWDSGPGNWDWEGTKLTSGDYNGDGVDDIGALYGYAAQHQTRAFIFTSNGINAFNTPGTWWDSGPGNWDWSGTKLSSGDYNADGLSDLSALYGYAAQHETRAFVFTSNGVNAFNAPTSWWDSGIGNWDWSGSTPISGDFSGDGRDDLAVFYGYGGNLTRIWELDSVTYSTKPPMLHLHTYADRYLDPYAAWDSGAGNWNYQESKVVVGDTNGDARADVVAFYNYPGQLQTKTFNLK